ncbi:MAG: mechanosensitive ion channel, partial [Alphaproteobacteria bacterium]|nr:mechanosensitive ion channel [Alphaproteobacteria bacterium]
MPLPEPLYTIAAPVIQYFDLPVKSTEILVELTLLAGSILLSVLGHIIIKHICAHHSRLPEYLPRLIALSLMAFTCWGTSTWLHQHEVNAPFISSIGVFVTLWIVFRITNRFKIPQTPRRILLATIASMGLLATGNYLRPLLDFLAEIKLPLGESNLSLLMIIQAIAIFMVFSWASFASATWMEKSMERNKMSPALITLLIKIFKTVALIFALLVTLNLMGINLSSLTIFGGALGIGIGFGLKTVTSNFISGILLLLDKSIKPGDVISIDDMTFGQVKAMNTRYIV